MKKLLTLSCLIIIGLSAYSQCRSVKKFRAKHPEDNNLFFYSSSLRMLDNEHTAEFGELTKNIDKIILLNYENSNSGNKKEKVNDLRASLKKEKYNELLIINDKGNKINLYGKEKNGIIQAVVALVEGKENLIVLDISGNFDINKFLSLYTKINSKLN